MKKFIFLILMLITTNVYAAVSINGIKQGASSGSGASDFSELTGTATDSQIPDDITITIQSDSVTLGTDTTGDYVATVADDGQGTLTINNSGSESAAITARVTDVICTDCIGDVEIADSYVFNTGDSITGDLDMGQNSNITFDGNTVDSNQTTLTVEDPSAARSFAIPDLGSGSVYPLVGPYSGASKCTENYYFSCGADGTVVEVPEPVTGNLSSVTSHQNGTVPYYSGTDGLLLAPSTMTATGDNVTIIGTLTAGSIILTENGDFTKSTSSYDPIMLIDFDGNTIDLGNNGYSASDYVRVAGGGAMTFHGSASFALPNGSAPTLDSVGEIALDTTASQIKYYDGSTIRVIGYIESKSFIIESLAAADDNYPLGTTSYARTITSVGCRCIGTCSTKATITLQDEGGNGMTITGTNPTCATTGTVTYAAVTAGNALTSGEGFAFDVTNTPDPETDTYEILWTETQDAQ